MPVKNWDLRRRERALILGLGLLLLLVSVWQGWRNFA